MFFTTDPGGIGIRVVQIPESVRSNPLSGIYIVQPLHAKSVVVQPLEVSNTTAHAISVALYPGAASLNGGHFSITSAGVQNELTSWITISPAVATIPAHGFLTAQVTFTVPKSVHSGTQYGVIWASASSKASAGGIINVNRVGVRMYMPISGKATVIHAPARSQPSWVNSHQLQLSWALSGLLFAVPVAIGAKKILTMRRRESQSLRSRSNAGVKSQPDIFGH